MVVRSFRMSWLDAQIAKHNEAISAEASLDANAGKVYLDLWQRIIRIVNEAKEKYAEVQMFPAGAGNERRLSAVPLGRPEDEWQLSLTLSEDQRLVVISMPSRTLKFDIGLGLDGVACLKQGGVPVDPQEAAYMIMGPFLFPDVYPI